MVRLVPLVHKAPPPPPENPYAVPTTSESSSHQSGPLPASILNRNQRRVYIVTKGSASSSSRGPSTHSITHKLPKDQNRQAVFSLFDALQELALTEAEFRDRLLQEGLEMKEIAGDGNCMFRSVADQVYGDEDMHEQVRACCLDYMEQEQDFFSSYVSIDFHEYIQHKRKLRVFGDHLELQAMAELYNRPVEIRIPGQTTLRICEVENEGAIVPLRLSYHNNNHYNSIRDPKNPAVGVGLGLPANQKPKTDKTLVAEAVAASLANEVEQQLLDATKLESEQDQLTDQLLADSAMKVSELEEIEDQLNEQEIQDQILAQQLAEQMDDEELRQAIALSLHESNGHQ